MASKFKDNEEYESRFSQLLRKSIKIEEDRNQTSTFIKLHEIVDYIKSKYIDSGQAIKSCLQDIINRSSPRNLNESITALELTNNQLQLFKSLKYEYLLSHSLMDTLTLKCLRPEDVEEYLKEMEEHIDHDESFYTSSPARDEEEHEDVDLNTSMKIILKNKNGKSRDNLEKKQVLFMKYLPKKLKVLKNLASAYDRVEL